VRWLFVLEDVVVSWGSFCESVEKIRVGAKNLASCWRLSRAQAQTRACLLSRVNIIEVTR
jgi:hypothetical protein